MNKYIEEYLSILKVERNLAYNSLDSYKRDLKKYRIFVKEILNIDSISSTSSGNISCLSIMCKSSIMSY
mgnify:CR=1 FL=1